MIKTSRNLLIAISLGGGVLASDALASLSLTRESQEPLENRPGIGAILADETLVQTPDDPQADAADNELKSRSTAFVIGALALALGLFLFLRHRIASSYAVDNPNETAIDDAVTAIRKGAADGLFGVVPRTLPNSPFTSKDDIPTLDRQIEIAAEACTRLSRTVGLIYFEAPVYAQIEAQLGTEKARQALANLVSELRRSLRSTDHVTLLDDYHILVCICLLANFSDLENISQRLRSVVERLGLAGAGGAMPPAGLSIYPLNGYSGAELISAAREDFRRAGGSDVVSFRAGDAAGKDSGAQTRLSKDNVVRARSRFKKKPPK